MNPRFQNHEWTKQNYESVRPNYEKVLDRSRSHISELRIQISQLRTESFRVRLEVLNMDCAGSGLPQGAFGGTIYFQLKWFKMGFCQWAEAGPKVGFWVQKWLNMHQNPLHPL